MKFPGIAKHATVRYGQSKVYIDLKRMGWRLYKRPSDKVEIGYSFKVEEPKKVWARVAGDLKRFNP